MTIEGTVFFVELYDRMLSLTVVKVVLLIFVGKDNTNLHVLESPEIF